jgi:amino acid transporter
MTQSLSASSPTTKLTGNLGVGSIIFMVVAAAAPLTVVAGGVPVGVLVGNGAAFPMTFVICAIVLLLFSVGFTAMSRDIEGGGAFYTYVAKGLGRSAGVGSAFLALGAYSAVQLAVYGFFGPSVNALLGTNVPWWLWSLGAVALVGFLGYRNIDLSGKVLSVLLVGEVGIVLVVSLFVVGKGGPDGYSTAMFTPHDFFSGSPSLGLVFAIAGFIGFEATAIFRNEAKDPDRTIPRATYLALLLIGGFYAFASWALVTAWGDNKIVDEAGANTATIFALTAKNYVGTAAELIVQVLLVTSLFACVLSFHNVLARYIHALSQSEVLPGKLGSTHDRHISPHLASLTQTVFAFAAVAVSALIGLDPVAQVFTWFSGIASTGIISLMLLTGISVVLYYRKRPGQATAWHTVVAPTLSSIGLAALLYVTVLNLSLLIGSPVVAWVLGLVLAGLFAGGFALAMARPNVARDILLESPAI